MSTTNKIGKFKVVYPKYADSDDQKIERVIQEIIAKIQVDTADDDDVVVDDDVVSSSPMTRTMSSAPPTEVDMLVARMSLEDREKFLREFMSPELGGSSCLHKDGVSSDPGSLVEKNFSVSDVVASSI